VEIAKCDMPPPKITTTTLPALPAKLVKNVILPIPLLASLNRALDGAALTVTILPLLDHWRGVTQGLETVLFRY